MYNVTVMEILAFEEQDYTSLYAFMQPLWLETYGDILPEKQIRHLVEYYFSPDGIAAFRKQGYEYFKLCEKEEIVGVLVFLEREKYVYLDKLYLLPTARGKEYPALAFAFMQTRQKPIRLNVNRANERAIKCYQKNGFKIIAREKIELGNGMINQDYVMQKRV